jgi:hypothetical protein
MSLIKPGIRYGIILIGLALAASFPPSAQAAWNGQPYAPGSTLNPECSPTTPNCTVAAYTFQNITDQGYVTTNPIQVHGVSTTADILPTTDNAYDLGSSASVWKKIFAKNTSSTALDVLTYVSTTNVYALGNVGIGTGNPTSQLTQKTSLSTESAPLGAELTDATNWTAVNWTGDYNAGFSHTPGNTTALSRTMTTTIGQTYQVSFTVTGRTAGTFTVSIGGVTSDEYFYYSNSFGPRAIATNGPLVFTPTSNFNGTISNISVKLVTGSYDAAYAILDSSGTANFEIRSSESSLENHYLGVGAGGYNTTGFGNTANGVQALSRNTSGYYNTANGSYALSSNRSGRYNTAEGVFSLFSNTTGTGNTAIGGESQPNTTAGFNNASLGMRSLYNNTTGYHNTADGAFALFGNTTGYYNSAFGSWALYDNTTGYHNTALGLDSISHITTGHDNIGIGYKAGRYIFDGEVANSTSESSLYIGSNTRSLADGGNNEIVIGTNAIGIGSNSVVLGNDSITKTALKGNVGIGTTNPYLFKLTINGSAAPSTTDSYDLGGTNHYWHKLYAKYASSTAMDVLGYVSTTNLYINGTPYSIPGLQQVTDQDYVTNNPIRVQGITSTHSILPADNNKADLGSATTSWRGIYASSTLDIGRSYFKVDFNGASIGTGETASNKLTIKQINSDNGSIKLISTSAAPGLSYQAGIDFSTNYPGTSDVFLYNKIYSRADCTQWICSRLTLATRNSDGDITDGLTVRGSSSESAKINVGIGTTNPYLFRLTVAGAVAPSTTDLYDLGASSYYWRRLYATNVSSSRMDALDYVSTTKLFANAVTSGNVMPSENLTKDLGSASYRWRDAWVSSTHIGTSTWDLWQANTGFTISKGLENPFVTVSGSGKMGIGTTAPNQGMLEVKGDTVCVDTNGDGDATNCIASESDQRLKKNTLQIDGALDKIMQLRGVTYDWKTDDPEILKHYPLISRFKGHEHTVGLIAQEVQAIYPEALSLETIGDKEIQYLQLDYTKFTPLIIEAIKEQQSQIAALKESQDLFISSNMGPARPSVMESQAGQAKVLSSEIVIKVPFKTEFVEVPVVTVTPMDRIDGGYWIEKADTKAFELHLAYAQPKDIIFNWQALANNNQAIPDDDYPTPLPTEPTPEPTQPSPDSSTSTDPSPTPTSTSSTPNLDQTSATSSDPISPAATTTQDQVFN